MDVTRIWLFLGAAFAIVAIPGPGVLYVVARSVDQGRRAGLVSVLGIGIGNYVQVLVAAVGLSALIASSAVAFEVLRIAGAAYLIWLGISRLRESDPSTVAIGEPVSDQRLLGQGVVVATLNPKTALFFVAFLPQFVDPAAASVAPQILLLGTVFVAMALVGDSLYALAAGTLADRFRGTPGVSTASRYLSAGVLLLLGMLALVGARRPT